MLELAQKEGKVLVKRRDGRIFPIKVEETSKSPFDVPGVKIEVSTKEILDTLREERGRSSRWR